MARTPTCTCSICGRKAPKQEVPDYQVGWTTGEQADRPVYAYKWVLPESWTQFKKYKVCGNTECQAALEDHKAALQQWMSDRKQAVNKAAESHQAEAQRLQVLIQAARAKVRESKKAGKAVWEKDNPEPTLKAT